MCAASCWKRSCYSEDVILKCIRIIITVHQGQKFVDGCNPPLTLFRWWSSSSWLWSPRTGRTLSSSSWYSGSSTSESSELHKLRRRLGSFTVIIWRRAQDATSRFKIKRVHTLAFHASYICFDDISHTQVRGLWFSDSCADSAQVKSELYTCYCSSKLQNARHHSKAAPQVTSRLARMGGRMIKTFFNPKVKYISPTPHKCSTVHEYTQRRSPTSTYGSTLAK